MNGEANAATTGNANKDGGSEKLKTWLPLATSVLTVILGFFIWNAQTAIQKRIDAGNMLLQQQREMQLDQYKSQLALKEAYYKRRLEVYERACAQITEMERSLADVGVTTETQKHATDAVGALYSFRKGNQLYWSQKLDERLDELWQLGIKKMRLSEVADGEQLNEDIAREVAELHAQMKADLELDQLGAKAFPVVGKNSPGDAGGSQAPK